ncbi:unnamed protein product [Caenorhabditis angaria]|uniref:Serpentine receptor class gamma n=1 Tax=Caenorhabditis angaria TaxID=860376 RepID=A0A9P1MWL3_9PELO|nr:unnamed protein product [Caenorhabditis angaria]
MSTNDSIVTVTVTTQGYTAPSSNAGSAPFYLTFFYLGLTIHYLIVLFIIRKFIKKTFFLIFFFIGCFDILECIALLWINFFRNAIYHPIYIPTSHLMVATDFFATFVNLLGNGMMSINRLSATFLSYDRYWRKNYVYGYLIGIVLTSFILSGPIIQNDREFALVNGAWVVVTNPPNLTIERNIFVVCILIYQVVAVIASAATIIRLKNISADTKKQEKSLVFITAIHCLFHFVKLYYQAVQIFSLNDAFAKFMSNMGYTISFLFVSLNSFTVMSNEHVRNDYMAFVFRRKIVKNISYPVSSNVFSTRKITVRSAPPLGKRSKCSTNDI